MRNECCNFPKAIYDLKRKSTLTVNIEGSTALVRSTTSWANFFISCRIPQKYLLANICFTARKNQIVGRKKRDGARGGESNKHGSRAKWKGFNRDDFSAAKQAEGLLCTTVSAELCFLRENFPKFNRIRKKIWSNVCLASHIPWLQLLSLWL